MKQIEHFLPYPDEACVEVKDPIIDNTTCVRILNFFKKSLQSPLTEAPFPGELLSRIDSANNDFARLDLAEDTALAGSPAPIPNDGTAAVSSRANNVCLDDFGCCVGVHTRCYNFMLL